VNARPTPYLDLELVCGGTLSSGYRHRRFPDQIQVFIFLDLSPSLDASFTMNSNGRALAHGWCTADGTGL
jgi:hypothetical protein